MSITCSQIDKVMSETGYDWFEAYQHLLIQHQREAFEYEKLNRCQLQKTDTP